MADGGEVHSRRQKIEVGPLQDLGGNWNDAGKWWARNDKPNGGPPVVPRTVRTTYSLGRSSMYFKGADKGFP
jgi:hypothetical protein